MRILESSPPSSLLGNMYACMLTMGSENGVLIELRMSLINTVS